MPRQEGHLFGPRAGYRSKERLRRTKPELILGAYSHAERRFLATGLSYNLSAAKCISFDF